MTLAPIYSNQFPQFSNSSGSPEDKRDFTLYVWGPGANDQPGTILFSQEFDDPRLFRTITTLTIDFFDLDLTPFASEISSLPDTIFVGFGEAGTPGETALWIGISSYTVENVSFLENSMGAWRELWGLPLQGGTELEQSVIPIRAQFATPGTPTAIDDLAEVPEAIVLYPNFPNPFNPTTSIRYALPQAAEVRLVVYDVLGRQVAVLAEGMKPPGEHLVEVDAGRWASGLYFYTIEAAGQKQTQRMVLIK